MYRDRVGNPLRAEEVGDGPHIHEPPTCGTT